ncbi:MAG: YraN family protein [Actinomycetota bacterium]|nr:YraN family protein [Actinomycetota bacterium]
MATTGTGRRKGTGGVVRAALGAFGEEVAAQHLVTQGMAILDRNWRCDIGEIDLVARDRDVLVVCEVKTRRGLGFGTPADAVTWDKLSRLRRLAARWLAEHPVGAVEVRIDVVEVLVLPNDGPRVEHLVGVG